MRESEPFWGPNAKPLAIQMTAGLAVVFLLGPYIAAGIDHVMTAILAQW